MSAKSVTICTFNVENLFMRYRVFGYLPGDKYKRKVLTEKELTEEGGFLPSQLYKSSFKIFDKGAWRSLTAKAIKGYGDHKGDNKMPDILCMQEVDSMDALRLFNEKFLDAYYDYAILIDSNDPRRIDVGVLSKYRLESMVTNMYDPYNETGVSRGSTPRRKYLFSRDCLELFVEIPGVEKRLTLFVNHLKSKYTGGKDSTKKTQQEKEDNDLREAQANRVAELVQQRFSGDLFNKENFVVLGDFNDTPDSTPLRRLLKDTDLENVVSRLDEEQRWTHWWDKENTASQIDYILLSPHLAKNSSSLPYIERRGISRKVKKFTHLGSKDGHKIPFDFGRFPQVSDKIEASDHCPIFIELVIE
jgi:endonuclease/exonuclease/phosphatase family metal-dependent hydrolase